MRNNTYPLTAYYYYFFLCTHENNYNIKTIKCTKITRKENQTTTKITTEKKIQDSNQRDDIYLSIPDGAQNKKDKRKQREVGRGRSGGVAY